MTIDSKRRQWLHLTGLAVIAAPLMAASRGAVAATNPELRAKLKYQDGPQADMSCANCMAFKPGKTAKDLGACELIPGDNEISPNAYCTGWYTM